ncbi:glucokinase [Undibacterium arcticum]
MLNDFEALALSLPRLRPSQIQAHAALPKPHGTLAVIGPGTGLGVAGVMQTCTGWVALPGEGGHATLAAADEFESALLSRVRRDYPHVSAERLLSGIGLPVLHGAVAELMGGPLRPVSLRSRSSRMGRRAAIRFASERSMCSARCLAVSPVTWR